MELAAEAEELADQDPEFDDACEVAYLLGAGNRLAPGQALWLFLRDRLRPLSRGYSELTACGS